MSLDQAINYPRLLRGDMAYAEVSESTAEVRQEYPFGLALDHQRFRVHSRDEQRRSVPENTVVVRSATPVSQEQTV